MNPKDEMTLNNSLRDMERRLPSVDVKITLLVSSGISFQGTRKVDIAKTIRSIAASGYACFSMNEYRVLLNSDDKFIYISGHNRPRLIKISATKPILFEADKELGLSRSDFMIAAT